MVIGTQKDMDNLYHILHNCELLLEEIEKFKAKWGYTNYSFGCDVVGSHTLIKRIKVGKVTQRTIKKVVEFMMEYENGKKQANPNIHPSIRDFP
jgi:hypothetical protein